jgi:hypothetical protein
MADGLSTANLANPWLNVLAGTSFGSVASTYVQLHTGSPGANGTSNVSSVTTREAVTWSAPSGGAMTESNTPTWSSWAGTNGEVVTDISVWSAASSGTFYFSTPLAGTATVFTATHAGTAIFTAPSTSYSAGQAVVLTAIAGGAIPTGFTADTIYYVAGTPSSTTDTFALAGTLGGTAWASSTTGTGIVQADGAKTVNTSDTLQLTSLTIALTPLAS